MIEYLNGKLAIKDPTFVVIDVNGIGYKVLISLSTYADIKDKEAIKLLTYLHIKEDAHTLYGFMRDSEKRMFLNLISVNGVGPSTGLMVQSSLSAAELKNAIIQEDVNTIKSVKGIGAKTAQRLILELKDKLARESDVTAEEISGFSHNTIKSEALTALVTLGINRLAAEKTLNKILNNSGNEITLEELIKQALKNT
ncbi:MAG: Holliday junction branch migration protein RuvA [Cyclobacteriaceae bacterium]|nr:Holliday junction branch migration protein RuvA [Cyclobacteriaceae bacterium]